VPHTPADKIENPFVIPAGSPRSCFRLLPRLAPASSCRKTGAGAEARKKARGREPSIMALLGPSGESTVSTLKRPNHPKILIPAIIP